MLFYDRLNVSEGIGISKASASKECDIFQHWYFLDKVYHAVYLQRMLLHINDVYQP